MRSHRARAIMPLLVLVLATVEAPASTAAGPSGAALPAVFDPGRILSDESFRASEAMDAETVQILLSREGAGCASPDGSAPCLKDYTETTPDRPAGEECEGYEGGADEGAATIVTKTAAACGVNPQVLLVLLEQAHGLVTSSGENLVHRVYDDAAGFSCSMAVDATDCRADGLANQVYGAASALRYYADHPGETSYPPGRESQIPYHADSSCGGAPVRVENAATAALYEYLRFQPNEAALAPDGPGDRCSSFGVRDFWRSWGTWFAGPGPEPTASRTEPEQAEPVEEAQDQAEPVEEAQEQAEPVEEAQDQAEPVEEAQDQAEPVEEAQEQAEPVEQAVPEDGLDLGAESGGPFGDLNDAYAEPGGVHVRGWAIDPDTTVPIYVWVTVDGVGRHLLANEVRADVAQHNPTYGSAHGFSGVVAAGAGERRVCATASNVARGSHTVLGCATVTVRAGSPFGNLERVARTETAVELVGWALDPDTTAPVYLWVTVDGVGRHIRADLRRDDVARALPGYGPFHGFRARIPVTPGPHEVCVTAANGAAGGHSSLGCHGSSAEATGNRSPVGNLELAAGGPNGIEIQGWAIDPDTASPVYVWVTVDGGWGRHVLAGRARADVGRAFPGYGSGHGFKETLAVTPGSHRVCVTLSNVGPGAHTPLGCADVRGSGGTLANTTFRVFTSSEGVKGQYHVFASDIDPRRSVGLMVQFHGDGAYEFTHPDSSYSLGGPVGLREQAAEHNMVLLVAKTPDVTGSPTWWESGPDNADYAAELIQRVVLDRYDVDTERSWLVGYSGGAQFVTKFLLPEHAELFDGGGAVVFAGGGVPGVTVEPFSTGLVADFPMHWYTGMLDDGTCLHHRYNALRDARAGSAYYAGLGFRTGLETPAGVCHNLSGRFGPVTAAQLHKHDQPRA